MRMLRPAFALDPRLFGRRFPGFILGSPEDSGLAMSDDAKLFATTFAIGFVFVSALIF
ncbi:MAG TPA: hypothetical protein VFH89_08810 [Sphingomicrobium sp.]|nr:hypothetical protein [Sphingomicrobium sp.]